MSVCLQGTMSTTANIVKSRRRLTSIVILLYACTVHLVASAALVSPAAAADELCDVEQCWSAPLISDRCAATCQLWWSRPADIDDPFAMPYKRTPSSFVRIGKSDGGGNELASKRYSSFVRIGRRSPSNKRYSSFVRIGRAGGAAGAMTPHDDLPVPAISRRGGGYSSFVRVGRNAH